MRPYVYAIIAIIVIAAFSVYYLTMPHNTSLTIYGSLDSADIQPVISAFQSSHKGVTVTYIEMTPPQAYQRIKSEIAAGNKTADLILMSTPITLQLEFGGYLLPYNSSNALQYPSNYKDPRGYWTSFALIPVVIAYNTQLLTPSQLPQNLTQLTSPSWKGKVIMLDPTLGSVATQYLGSLQSILGNTTWVNFVVDLEKNVRPSVTPSTTTVTTDVASGQYELGIVALMQDVLDQKAQGAPVSWYLPKDLPLMAYSLSVAIIKSTQHLTLAKEFYDFVLSSQGQTILGNTDYRIPAMPGISARNSIETLAPGYQIHYFPNAMITNESNQLAGYFKQLGY